MDPNYLSKSDKQADPQDEAAQQAESPPDPAGGFSPLYTEAPSPYQEERYGLKHSGPGITSFTISLVTLVGYIITFMIAGSMAGAIMNETDNLTVRTSESIMTLGMAVLGLIALNVIGVIVGIIGISLRGRRKIFGILGTILNGVIILLFMLMVSAVLVNAGAM
ncbi:hypothetical protein GCM10010912_18290 [Paenibacillus albidus]|uniref:Uncharacterized protein n=1 Tax=Paenibacillus albidus TaxID=2041023 RepID=A0A917C5U5_9BACL|nr:hypothetical protein [Paenibacillus albidus]GGF73415.1 hypothetical protein GCM10010912_18290 [Paenibacillus albidus]